MSRPLRVHLVHQGFGDYVDGLVGGLQHLGPDAVELSVTTVISGPASLTRLRSSPEPHRQLTLPRFRDPRSAVLAGRRVREVLAEPCDLLHWQAAGNPWADMALLRWLGRRRRPPAVVTVHDMQAHPGDRSVLPGTFAAIRRLVRKADRVVVHAPHVRDQAVTAGAEPDRVAVMAHGELATRYLPLDELPLAPSTEPTILFFGRAQGYKGLDVAAGAMGAVAERVPGARLVVAGSGPSIDEVFPPGVELPAWCELHRGRVAVDAVAELFRRAAIVVLPYREASQSGVAALAAGFGRPVVASRVPGLADIVADGRSGRLVEPGSVSALAEALVDLLADEAEAARLGAGGFELASTELAWPNIAKRLAALYHDAVQSFPVGPSSEDRVR